MAVTAALVKQLREMTGTGMMDCRKALAETDGDIDKAVEFLQKKGQASAHKKAGRIASEGVVEAYIHAGGKVGVMVELNCETDFVARTDAFKELAHDLCLHIAAMSPQYLAPEDIPEDEVARQTGIFAERARQEGKPDKIVDKIAEGRLRKWYSEICLTQQTFVKDSDKTIEGLIKDGTANIGEKISIRRFVRYVMGEGLEKKEHNLLKDLAEMQQS